MILIKLIFILVLFQTTLGDTPMAPPRFVSFLTGSFSNISILRLAPATNANGAISQYSITLRRKDGKGRCIWWLYDCKSCRPSGEFNAYGGIKTNCGDTTWKRLDLHNSNMTDIKIEITNSDLLRIAHDKEYTLLAQGNNGAGWGEVLTTTITISQPIPGIPTNLQITKSSKNSIEIVWDKPVVNETYGELKGYHATIIRNNNFNVTVTSSNKTVFYNLEECTKHCFIVRAYNDEGNSGNSTKFCEFTRAPKMGKIEIDEILPKYSTSRNISWKYKGKDKCAKSFQFHYKSVFDKYFLKIQTNKSYVTLTNLTLNMKYEMKVVELSLISPENGVSNGTVSQIKSFYTGNAQITCTKIKLTLDTSKPFLIISWTINLSDASSINAYYVAIRLNRQTCVALVKLRCSNCFNINNEKSVSFKEKNPSNRLPSCLNNTIRNFSYGQEGIEVETELKFKSSKYYIDVYVVNLIGLQLLFTESTVTGIVSHFYIYVIIGGSMLLGISIIIIKILLCSRKRKVATDHPCNQEIAELVKPIETKSQVNLPTNHMLIQQLNQEMNERRNERTTKQISEEEEEEEEANKTTEHDENDNIIETKPQINLPINHMLIQQLNQEMNERINERTTKQISKEEEEEEEEEANKTTKYDENNNVIAINSRRSIESDYMELTHQI